ncbi:enolase-phosphatase E1-like [Ctenocephalides felis]|uniref:enolase-phosphatase E1-like n=1 Tax=Ctenocephalides felis TaxID=7515 RepID=UPI000E6E2366|nr:enolase-phosphatase E1-like [Ctenocephalides felis]
METAQQFDTKITSAKTILLDIEGTTTSKSFVKDTLFPYASDNVQSFLTSNWESADVKSAVSALRELAVKDKSESVEGCVEIIEEDDSNREAVIKSVVDNVKWQISLDRKTGALKTLQGLIWEKGYKDGTIKGHVYDDVPEALTSWSASGHQLYIYSSGSVAAQKLLFGNTEKGDLLDKISGHFDTSVGGKQEVDSYKNISKEIGCDQILFLTDIVNEANAALEAGMAAVLVQRDSETSFTDEDREKHTIIKSFSELPLEAVSAKRKSDDKDEEEHPAKLAKIEQDEVATTIAEEKSVEVTESAEKSNEVSETSEKSVEVVDSAEKSNEVLTSSSAEEVVKDTETPMDTDVEMTEVPAVSAETTTESSDKVEPTVETTESTTTQVEKVETTTDVEKTETEVEMTTDVEKTEKTETEPEKAEVEQIKPETETEKPQETEKPEEEQKPEETKTETNEVEPMEVDSGKKTESEEVVSAKASEETVEVEEPCDSTDAKTSEVVKESEESVVAATETETVAVTTTDVIKENGEKTEDKTNSEIDSTKPETVVSEENEAENKVEANGTAEVKEAEVSEVSSEKAQADVNVTSSDAKPSDENDHTLKESNGVETNGTNGLKSKIEGNGDVVESSTNGADSDKENDKEAEVNGDNVTNGSTNGVSDEAVQEVKVKKLPADSSPAPAPVEEAA